MPELERGVHRGMQGVKIWKNLGMHYRDADGKLLRIDDPRLDTFWKKVRRPQGSRLHSRRRPQRILVSKSFNTYQYEAEQTAQYF